MDAQHFIEPFLTLGLLGPAAIALIEKFAPVVPSYVVLMLLGLATSDGMALVMTVFATAAGSLAGSVVWYRIGRALGAPRVESAVARFGKYVFFSARNYQRLADAYRHNHFLVTLIGQTIPVARIYLALPAGVFRLQPVSFTVAAAIGILLWNTPFLVLGHLLRGGGRDPIDVGFWVSIVLIGAEMAIAFGIRRYGKIARWSNDSNREIALP